LKSMGSRFFLGMTQFQITEGTATTTTKHQTQ